MRFIAIISQYPNEAAIIGQIVIGYGELEIALMNTVQAARNGDLDTTLKTMFRSRGESRRIEVGDALGRQAFTRLGFGREFETAIANMNYCRRMRNQYAHCIWHNYDPTGQRRLGFANLEELSKTNSMVTSLGNLTYWFLDIALLQEQIDYLDNTEREIGNLGAAASAKLGSGVQIFQAPTQLPRPPLYRP
jgi:hypothetical protein